MIAVLGAEGMAGHMIYKYLKSKNINVIGYSRKDFDASKDELPCFYGLSCVVNCIGVLGPDSNKDIGNTSYINAVLPKMIENKLMNTDTRIIHISTDCVFDGKKGNYKETDIPTETGIYGVSKACGEINNNKDTTLRVSIIGPEIKEVSRRSGLLNWVLTNPNQTLQGWTNAIWNGITTLQLAKNIYKIIDYPGEWTGIQHPVSKYPVDKATLLSNIVSVYGLDIRIEYIEGPKRVDKSLVCTKSGILRPKTILEQLIELKEFTSAVQSL